MSVHTANSEFRFELPSLSYVDVRWEEPNLRTPADPQEPVRKAGLASWFTRRIAAFLAWRRDQQAMSELTMMSDHQLADLGIGRSDVLRIFDPAFNADLRQRGNHRY